MICSTLINTLFRRVLCGARMSELFQQFPHRSSKTVETVETDR
jgi:hypothetical protein